MTATWVFPPPRLIVPPRPWNSVRSMSCRAAHSARSASAFCSAHRAAPIPAAEEPVAPPAMGGHEVPEPVLDKIRQSQEALQRLQFNKAEVLGYEAVEMYPRHPLPHLMLAGVYLFWIQDSEIANRDHDEVAEKFYKRSETVLTLAWEQEKRYPGSAYTQVYLGGIYGSRGMVNLYQGHYWSAYKDGKKAIGFLRKAVELDPDNMDAWFGMGQFEYYCGRLAGVLQFFLRLQGDEEAGIRMMMKAAEHGTYARIPTRAFLSQVFTEHRKEWVRAVPFVDEMYRNYPENFNYFRYNVQVAVGLGLDRVDSKARMERAAAQWDGGWRPPEHGRFPFDMARMALARQYMDEGKLGKAVNHLNALVVSEDRSLAAKAQETLQQMETPEKVAPPAPPLASPTAVAAPLPATATAAPVPASPAAPVP